MTSSSIEINNLLDNATIAARALLKEVGVERFTSPDFHSGKLQHIVLFRFKKNVIEAERREVTKQFLELAKTSKRPDGQSVIVSIETGSQNSGENAGMDMDQGYIVTFNSEGDRNYYVGRPLVNDPAFFDAAHEQFKSFAGTFLEKAIVFDFKVANE
ncbi:stress responsive alpha/beta barrel protein [Zymomonas mobilis]|uniref:Dabb family protein n=1 Tax=Zymomonas mobilis TaxID=542 RepID=UPI000B38667C|nr:Dabb family protein [Zymomonas mobilis]ART93403.1 stress responsive protein [Zymomonas mobilis subsp. mobilis]TWD60096.1 stress responsive alpha/beta barrel protein [Zymomonas mobilis]